MDRGAWWATVHGVEKETQLAATQQTVTFVCVLLSHGRLFVTPWTQLARLLCLWGFSRQEYWRGLSCASPGYLLNPGIEPRSPHTAGGFFTIWVAREAQEYWSGLSCILHGIFTTQGFNQVSPHCRQILLQSEPPEKPKNTGVGSLSLFQGIFPTQDLNRGLPDCRRILYNSRKA